MHTYHEYRYEVTVECGCCHEMFVFEVQHSATPEKLRWLQPQGGPRAIGPQRRRAY
jgi:hypothetical protein